MLLVFPCVEIELKVGCYLSALNMGFHCLLAFIISVSQSVICPDGFETWPFKTVLYDCFFCGDCQLFLCTSVDLLASSCDQNVVK